MKKSFLLRIQLSLAVVGLAAFTIAFPATTNAQEPKILCEGKDRGSVWAATCCNCKDNCVLIDAKPRMPGDCRECHLLCVECREAMGDLNQALEKLKQKNSALYKAYQIIEDDLNESNKKFYDAATRITGIQEDREEWNLDGLTGSFGNFSTSLLGFASNFTGTGKTTRLIDKKWLATGGTIVSNGAGIYQTASGRNDYSSNAGIADAVANWIGALSDFLSSDFWKWLQEILITMDEIGVPEMIYDIINYKPYPTDLSALPGPEFKFTPADIEGFRRIALISDIWGLGRSSFLLVNDLTDLLSSWSLASDAEKELQKIQDEILKNNTLMACIRETQEFLNKGGPTLKRKSTAVSGEMAVYLIAPAIISFNHNSLSFFSKKDFFKSKFRVDEFKLKSAISTLKQLINVEKQNETIFAKKIFPAFFPWINGKWKNYEPRTLVQRLQNAKEPFQNLIRKCDEMTRLYQSIKADLKYAVIFERQISDGSSNIENSPLSEYTDGFYLIENDPGNAGTEKWVITPVSTIKGVLGRLDVNFPPDVYWGIQIYQQADNKYEWFTSVFSSKSKSYSLAPGVYLFDLMGVPVENVPIQKGHETRLKAGFLDIVSEGNWHLYNEAKEKIYTSGHRPNKIALPVGSYLLHFESKDYTIKIKNGVILKFELRKPLFVDQ